MSVTAPEDTRGRIREVALELFRAQGFDKTSLREIADRLRVTKAALYYHFHSKDELVASLLNPFLDALTALLDDADQGGRRAGPARAGLAHDLVENYLDLLLEHRPLIAWLTSDVAVLAHPSVGPRIQSLGERLRVRLGGGDMGFADQVRVTAALGALNGGVASFPEAPTSDLRGPLLQAAWSVLGRPPGG